jgi:hypothetical protein
MNALTKLAPVMMILCGLLLLGTVASLITWMLSIPNRESIEQAIYNAINFIYFAEIAFIATVLWIKKDSTRALSFYLYLLTLLCSQAITRMEPINIQLLQVVSGAASLSLLNILIQSYYIQPKQLAQGYIVFSWTLVLQQIVYLVYPYYAASHYYSMDTYRYLSLLSVITYGALLFALIHIKKYLDAERLKGYMDAVSKNDMDPYSNL